MDRQDNMPHKNPDTHTIHPEKCNIGEAQDKNFKATIKIDPKTLANI